MAIEQAPDRRPITARNFGATKWIARKMAEAGFTPNQISLIGLAAGIASGLALGLTAVFPDLARLLWIVSAAMVVLRGLANMFDGMVAVEHGLGSPVGMFYNEVPDRISDVALMVGAGYSLGGSEVAGWAAACVALFVTYVRVVGAHAGAAMDFCGPMAKQHRMFSLAAISAWLALTPAAWRLGWGPDDAWGLTAAVLWIIVAGGIYTAVIRLRRAVAAVRSRAAS